MINSNEAPITIATKNHVIAAYNADVTKVPGGIIGTATLEITDHPTYNDQGFHTSRGKRFFVTGRWDNSYDPHWETSGVGPTLDETITYETGEVERTDGEVSKQLRLDLTVEEIMEQIAQVI